MSVLVIAAHPDDEVLGCGGTIARLSRESQDIYLVILGEGITSRYGQRQDADQMELLDLRSRSQQVAKLLGAKDLFLYDLPDNRFDTLPLLDLTKIIEEIIKKVQPQIIYTHHGGDLNLDHSLTFRATLTATRPMTGSPVKEIYTFEVPSSTEWAFGRLGSFNPNVFVDVNATIETKLQGMAVYQSELRPYPHPRSPEAIRAISRRWGSVAGCEFAEAFELIRSLR